MKKKVVGGLLLVVVLLLAIAPAVHAWWWDRYYVDIASADFGHITMTYDSSCPWRCNEYGREEGYGLYIGYGATKQECRSNAGDNPMPNMVSSPFVYRWPAEVIMEGFEPGDMACIWWCCQPVAPIWMYGWKYMDIDGAPWW